MSRRGFRWLRNIGFAVAIVQAIILIAYSAHIYSHFDLTLDFGVFNQGWTEIAHGHLNPYSTVNPHNYPHYGYPFLHDHFALIMWPLALLWLVYPHSIDLLVIQDLATAGSTLVAFLFVVDLFEFPLHANSPKISARIRGTAGPVLLSLCVLVLLVGNPWVYWADSFDFHLEAVATCFLLLTARDLWFGRTRRSILWIVAVVLCGNVSTTWLIGLGVGLIIVRKNLRWPGAILIALGIVWAAVISAAGGAVGTLISNYAYLAGPSASPNVGMRPIIVGLLSHPSRGLHILHQRWLWTYRLLATSGLLGVVTAIGIGVTLTVVLPSDLNISPVFSGPISSFQNLPLYFFVPIGSVLVIAWVLRAPSRFIRWAVVPVGVAILIQSVVLAAIWVPKARTQFLQVDSAAATQLERVQAALPATDEVVVSQGVLGRFADRAQVFPFLDIANNGQVFPVFHHRVVFILTSQGIEFASASGTQAAVQYLDSIHAHVLTASGGVFAFSWNPPPGTRTFTFPPAPAE